MEAVKERGDPLHHEKGKKKSRPPFLQIPFYELSGQNVLGLRILVTWRILT